MVKIYEDTMRIDYTRGDVFTFRITAENDDQSSYEFQKGDVVRFKVFKRKDCNCVEIQKDVEVQEPCSAVDINLTSEDTKIGDIINKPVDYWYEVELNPETSPQTILGYEVDKDGKPKEKIFKLLPEGSELK